MELEVIALRKLQHSYAPQVERTIALATKKVIAIQKRMVRKGRAIAGKDFEENHTLVSSRPSPWPFVKMNWRAMPLTAGKPASLTYFFSRWTSYNVRRRARRRLSPPCCRIILITIIMIIMIMMMMVIKIIK